MPIALRLKWWTCPDGYGLHDYGDAPLGRDESLVSQRPRGLWVRPKSARLAEVDHLLDGADSLVFKFLRTGSVGALLAFSDRYGLPSSWPWEGKSNMVMEEQLDEIRRWQRDLHTLLQGTNAPNATLPSVRATIALQPRSAGLRPAMVLHLQSLIGLMLAEIAFIHSGEKQVMTCAQCGDFFLVGAGRGAGTKRVGSIYCSPRCRVAATRARAKVSSA